MNKKKNNAIKAVIAGMIVVVAAVCISIFIKSKVAPVVPENVETKSTQSYDDTNQQNEQTSAAADNTVSETENKTESEATSEKSASESDKTVSSSEKKAVFYTTEALNVRVGPGENYEKVGLIPKNSKVVVVGEVNDWSKIEYSDGIRYVYSKYLTETDPQQSTEKETNISQTKRNTVDPKKGNWNLIIVNAYNEYDRTYTPELAEVCPGEGYDRYMDVRAAEYFTRMYNAAKKDGITLVPLSGYRSYALQEKNWKARIESEQKNGYSYNEAVERASEVILPPGTSEHNLGIAMDICSLYDSFAQTKEYAWLCEHAEEYGFILRYKAQWKDKTGIVPEPWHWRYVGVEYAAKINRSGLCLEDYVARYGTD